MIENIKTMLGAAAANYTDGQIQLMYDLAASEVEEYCNRTIDRTMEMIAEKIAVIKLLRMGSEGLSSQSFSGVSESYVDGYPADIIMQLNRKRKIKVV